MNSPKLMTGRERVRVEIHLDGPREASAYLPGGWETWDETEREAFVRRLKASLLDSTVDFYVTAPWEEE